MILDRLEESIHYAPLGRRFAAGFAYLRETDLVNLADGRYEIDGKNVLAIVQAYLPKSYAEGRWEAHRDHADIQFIASGAEQMGVTPMNGVTVETPYDPATDVEFYRSGVAGKFFEVNAGEFALFYPHDVHMPSLELAAAAAPDRAKPQLVKKVVIKVRLR
jgi:YhcH/YjgK/YiaL family protein